MVELSNVTKNYGRAQVLQNICLTLDEPGIYCLLGRNGAGKTTLLKAMAGYVPLSQGRITVDGRPISTACMETGVSYIENFARHFNLPVRRLLHIAGGLDTSFDFAFAQEMMERFELDGAKNSASSRLA